MPNSKMDLKLVIFSDGDKSLRVEMPEGILPSLKTISNMLEDIAPGDSALEFPVPEVQDQKTLDMLAAYALADLKAPVDRDYQEAETIELAGWEKTFFAINDKSELTYIFQLIATSNYLEYNRLFHASCQAVANLMKGKTPEQLRELFDLPDDLTDEEKERLYRENGLSFIPNTAS